MSSMLGNNLGEYKLGISVASNLANRNFKPLPYYLLEDDIFSLKSWLICPFPGSKLDEMQNVLQLSSFPRTSGY